MQPHPFPGSQLHIVKFTSIEFFFFNFAPIISSQHTIGEEEEQYWQKVLEAGKNRKTRGPAGKRGRRYGGPGGRGGYGGRKRRQKFSASEDGDGGEEEGGASPPVAKQPKAEDKED